MKIHCLVVGLIVFTSIPALANPTGGVVTSGAATINPVVGKTLTINQTTQNAIINWNTFSINYGETTRFVQPNATSAALNRVTGGGTSIIDGTLTANGQVYLINGNGIYVGGTGKVSTNGFIASTQDIADTDFLSGNLHFTGNSNASVQNLGAITALGGNIYLIGRQVSNSGTLYAPTGAVGLAAAQDVVVAQKNSDGSSVTVSPTSVAASVSGNGVNNSGVISSAVSELRAANGNIYALAINNSGTIRATGVAKKNGKIWLVADSGTVQTSGALETTAAGKIETSGDHVGASGIVSAGVGGSWTIDPVDVTISSLPSSGTIVVNATTLGKSLSAGSNVAISAIGGATDTGTIDVLAPVTWTSGSLLTLNAATNINIDAAITAPKGLLGINATGNVTAPAAVNVSSFTLESGFWNQIVGPGLTKLPVFSATSNFAVYTGATFARFAGGDGGGTPFKIVDIYGLEGIESGNGGSINLQDDNYSLQNSINATATATWNGGQGAIPISNLSGIFNGNKFTITGFTINRPSADDIALFHILDSTGVVENLNLANANIAANTVSALLVDTNFGTILNCAVSGTLHLSAVDLTNIADVGGLVGTNEGQITGSSSSVILTVPVDISSYSTSDIGGLVGLNSGGTIISSSSSGKLTFTGNGSITGGTPESDGAFGGLVGANAGTILSSTSKTVLTVSVSNTTEVGGLTGLNSGTISSSSNSGALIFSDNGSSVGGLVGTNESAGTITSSFNTGAITIMDTAVGTSSDVGGLVGFYLSTGSITSCYNTGSLTLLGTGSSQNIGGLAGSADESSGAGIGLSHNSGAITDSETGSNIGGLIGMTSDAISVYSCQNTGAIKLTGAGVFVVGGLIGTDGSTGAITLCSATEAISSTAPGGFYGGLLGADQSPAPVTYCNSGGTMTLGVGPMGDLLFGGLAGQIGSSAGADAITITFDSSKAVTNGSVGGAVGFNLGTLTACTNSGNIIMKDISAVGTVSPAGRIGGVVGADDGSLTSCSNSGLISVGGPHANNIGGVVGAISVLPGRTPTIFSSSNSGAISALGNDATNVGGVIGTSFSGSVFNINTVSNSGAVTTGALATNVGGVVGIMYSGSVLWLTNTGAVKTGASSALVGGDFGELSAGAQANEVSNTGVVVAGIGSSSVGGAAGEADGVLETLYSTGEVSANGLHIGGLVGDIGAAGRVENGYSTGAVVCAGTNNFEVGGLVGLNFNTTANAVEETYSTGKVTAKGTNIGGLIGSSADPTSVSLSYWSPQTSGQLISSGGTSVATLVLMKTQSTYVGWDFVNVWGINIGGTPYLLAFDAAHRTGF